MYATLNSKNNIKKCWYEEAAGSKRKEPLNQTKKCAVSQQLRVTRYQMARFQMKARVRLALLDASERHDVEVVQNKLSDTSRRLLEYQ